MKKEYVAIIIASITSVLIVIIGIGIGFFIHGRIIQNDSIEKEEKSIEDSVDSKENKSKKQNVDLEENKIKDNNVNSENNVANNEKTNSYNTKSNNSANSNRSDMSAKKIEYLNRLASIQDDINNRPKPYSTVDIVSARSREYQDWDNILNEIYGYLRENLPSDEFEALKQDEIRWIKEKEENANATQSQEGSIRRIMYVESLVKDTKSRCYVLVNEYMK